MSSVAPPPDDRLLRKVARWLTKIGLKVEQGTRFEVPFNVGIWIEDGGLIYDPAEAHPGNLLHDAGHLAIIPSIIRPLAKGDIIASIEQPIEAYLDSHQDAFEKLPEDPIARACLQCGDAEAIAWAYAAAIAARVDPWLTCEQGFSNRNDAEHIYRGLQVGAHLGVNGLRAAGFIERVDDFPRLTKWVQA